jgi:hypothetical protein
MRLDMTITIQSLIETDDYSLSLEVSISGLSYIIKNCRPDYVLSLDKR